MYVKSHTHKRAHFLSLSMSLVRLCFSPLAVIQFSHSMSISMYPTISHTSCTDIDNTNKKIHNKQVVLSCDLYDDLEYHSYMFYWKRLIHFNVIFIIFINVLYTRTERAKKTWIIIGWKPYFRWKISNIL